MRLEVSDVRPIGFRSLSKLPLLLGGLFVCLTSSCKKPSPPLLRVRIGGCSLLAERMPRNLCAANVRNGKRLILAIEGPPMARLSLRIGDAAPRESRLSRSGQVTFDEPYPTVASLVALRAESAEGVAEYAVDVAPTMPFVKADARNATIDCQHSTRGCLDAVQRVLTSLDASPRELDATEQAFLLGLLGKKVGEASREAEDAQEAQALRKLAIPLFERAMAEAQATGLLSVEAWALERLGQALRDQGAYDLHLAAAKLSDPVHARALSYCPEAWGNVLYWQSLIAEDSGDLSASKRYAREAFALDETFAPQEKGRLEALQQVALAAQSLQEAAEAERLTEEIGRQLDGGLITEPCTLTKHYNMLAWTKLVARQTGHLSIDPDVWFQKVAAVLPRCEEERKAQEEKALLLTNRALYSVLRAEQAPPGSHERLRLLDDAEAIGRNARDGLAKVPRATQSYVKLDFACIKARSALLRGQGEDALRAFAELEKLTTRERLVPYYLWASQVGQADAYQLLGDKQAALARYAQAEALLDRVTDGLPMATRRQLYLKQFEAGTGRYLQLLLETSAAESTVLRVIRHARVRALRAYTLGPGAASGQSRTAELYNRYWALLDEREAAAGELLVAPVAEQEAVLSRLRRLQREQEAVLENLYTVGSALGEQAALRPPAAGELLIACYPLPSSAGGTPGPWLCAGASASTTKLVRIAAPIQAAPEQAAQALLAALGEMLPKAWHLRVLPYGLLRAIAWAALPFASGRLEDRFSISYGVDLPSHVGATPAKAGGALLVINPQQDLFGAQRTGERLRHEMRAAGWQLVTREGAPRRGGHPLQQLRDTLLGPQLVPALAKDVIARLPSANLFIYYGHAESSGAGGWDSHLQFAEGGRISAQDIMSLPAAPQKVLLIGCETAVSDRDAPADEAGLAQAFVLRGSEAVLATTRKVADVTAEALVSKLAQLGALRPGGPPLAAALREAIATLRSQQPAADLDAFRVYTP